MEHKMRYPNYFPKGCPPKEADNTERIVYRICKDANINHTDFLSFYEMGIMQNSTDIKKYGISVNKNKDELITLLGMPSQKNKNMKCIAKGITKKDLGVSAQTPSNTMPSHITWWLKENADPENYFKCDYLKGE